MAKTLFTLLNTTAEFHLKGPDGELLYAEAEDGSGDLSKPIMVRVQSPNLPAIKAKSQEAETNIHLASRTEDAEKLLKLLRKAESLTEDITGLAIVGWNNDEYFGGPFTPEYAKELAKKPEFGFIRVQVNTFVADQSHFFRTKPKLAHADAEVAA